MRGRSVSLIAGLAVAGTVLASTPATAQPIDKGHFDVFRNGDATTATALRPRTPETCRATSWPTSGSSAFPYFRESLHGTVVTTNLETGGTFTNVFTANSRDHVITDNGDGTIAITVFARVVPASTTPTATSCSRTPVRPSFAFDVDYNGTPSDPSDDVEVPDSFRVVRASTGNSDLSDAASVPTWWSSPAERDNPSGCGE